MRLIRRYIRYEICVVDKVYWHKSPGDVDFNVCDVVMRDRRLEDDPDFAYIRHRLPSLQARVGRYFGRPQNPRRGDAVKVLFYQNWKGIIVGVDASKGNPPVCRPDPYTDRDKRCQYRPHVQNATKDFDDTKAGTYPEGNKPSCVNWQHGPCFGDKRDDQKEPSLGRDFWQMYDFCAEGDEDPTCEKCVDIDYPKRCKNTWRKVYSANTQSCQAPNHRLEDHVKCGAYLRFESETGQSVEYSEGCGHIRLGGATCESKKKGHFNHNPKGTIDIHSVHEEVSIASESQGTRVIVVAPDDLSVLYAVESKDFETGAYIRILKSGEIVLHSPIKITLDAPLVEETHDNLTSGDNEIKGFCTHPGCTCHNS